MYYNRILGVWVFDLLDYFLLSATVGSTLASYLKDYLSEKKAMERLKNSIIQKSELVIKYDRPIPNSKKITIQKIYKFALGNRGGQLEHPDNVKLAHEIKRVVERLAIFLKERELKGVARIFFKNGRLLLELLLYKCKIDITYALLTEGLSTQVIVMTATAGGIAGFTLSWFTVGASLVAPAVLISMLFMRSVGQQIVNQRDYSKFKKLVNRMLEDDEIKQTIQAFFIEGEVPSTNGLKMETWDSNKNPLPKFNLDSDQTLEEVIKARMKDEFGLIENPTSAQLKEIIYDRKIGNKGKTVNFKDFIKDIAEDSNDIDIIDGDIIDADIIDAEIVKKSIKVKVKNEEL